MLIQLFLYKDYGAMFCSDSVEWPGAWPNIFWICFSEWLAFRILQPRIVFMAGIIHAEQT